MSIEDQFKDAMATWASGVTVVSTKVDDKMYGLTASSFSSLSLKPPLVLVCLANTNRMPAMIQESRKFAISILAREQEELSNYFARSGREPSNEFDPSMGKLTDNDVPVLLNCAGYVACNMHEMLLQGDHTIAVGEVIEAYADPDKAPLIYYRRAYRGVTGL